MKRTLATVAMLVALAVGGGTFTATSAVASDNRNVTVQTISQTVLVKGKKVVISKTRPAPKRGEKVIVRRVCLAKKPGFSKDKVVVKTWKKPYRKVSKNTWKRADKRKVYSRLVATVEIAKNKDCRRR